MHDKGGLKGTSGGKVSNRVPPITIKEPRTRSKVGEGGEHRPDEGPLEAGHLEPAGPSRTFRPDGGTLQLAALDEAGDSHQDTQHKGVVDRAEASPAPEKRPQGPRRGRERSMMENSRREFG